MKPALIAILGGTLLLALNGCDAYKPMGLCVGLGLCSDEADDDDAAPASAPAQTDHNDHSMHDDTTH